MGYLVLNDYDNNYQETSIEYASMRFYNYQNNEHFTDPNGVHWTAHVQDTADVKIVDISTDGDARYNTYNTELLNSLGIYDLSIGDSDIVSAGYTGQRFGKGENSPDTPWMKLISLNAQGTHIILRDTANRDFDPIIGLVNNGRPFLASPLAWKRYGEDDAWYGFLAMGYTGAGSRRSVIVLGFARWLTYETWGVLNSEPGENGYRPTGLHYNPTTKPGVGGKGHNQHPTKHTPAYDTDVITNPSAPDESVASIINAGLITPYKIDGVNLGHLASCLYGTTLGGLITNLAINPLDFIISLNIFPCTPTVGASTNVVLGRWVCTDSGIDNLGGNVVANRLLNQFKVVHFGSINIYENWGSFLDYANTTIELYLPFIGFVNIDTSEVMNGSITVDYTIDFLTGMCVANVNCNKNVEAPDGTTYPQSSQHAYQGNCAISVPLSSMQYGQMIGSLINAGVSGLRGGIAGAGLSLMGDFIAGNLSPQGTTKGSLSGNAGFCSVLYPYIRISRPVSAESDSFQEVMGYPSYIDSSLGNCEGLCVCDAIDLHSVTGATDSEIERIRQMCLEGVHV